MVPPTEPLNLDITAISGIFGSISIACWLVVFSPQIVENFRRSSADGLSVRFVMVWLTGDFCNIIGAVLQGVLPTMIILAVYYAFADIVLLSQCFYYRGFTWKDEVKPQSSIGEASERTGLLPPGATGLERRPSNWSEASHLSPVVPLHSAKPNQTPSTAPQKPNTPLQAFLFNGCAILMVCAAGILGWYVSNRSQGGVRRPRKNHSGTDNSLNLWGQVFGYFCAILYLGSRIPQILLNYRRKSTEGVSMLFFLFACIGNLTYVLSIFAYDPLCKGKHGSCEKGEARAIYGQYILMNASWIAGSLGTLFLDLGIFAQFFVYRERVQVGKGEGEEEEGDERPLLERDD